ncbi:MAG: N-acetylmuramoyl-L-alanine amidase [Nitrospinae bacterium]|nr:N-acetylmuramoyl-L-alanine amidase [Nitrospinota bacterium]
MRNFPPIHKTVRIFITALLVLVFCLGSWLSGAEAEKASSAPATELYEEARQVYYSLTESKTKRSSRSQWINVIDKFRLVIDKFPQSHEGYKATFTIARLYHALMKELGNPKDLDKAFGYYWKLLSEYPVNRLSDDALLHLGDTYIDKKNYIAAQQAFRNVVLKFPDGDQVEEANKRLKEIEPRAREQLAANKEAEAPVLLEKLEYSTRPNSVRITVETRDPVSFNQKRLSDPDRIYFNFENTELAKGLTKNFQLESDLLKQVRLSQFDPRTSRLVLDLQPENHVEVVARQEKSRIIIDVHSNLPKKNLSRQNEAHEVPHKTPNKEVKKLQIAQKPHITAKPFRKTASSKKEIPIIVIDPGHGGKDDGAKGQKGLLEKHVNLAVSQRLKKVLEKRYKFNVIMTREDDTFISLKGRGEIANQKGADLFVSVHANAAPRKSAKGIETYYLGSASSERALSTAARENGELVQSVSDNQVQKILASLISTTKMNDSARLAGRVQSQLHKQLSKKYSGVNNLGVKEGPFFVLHDTNMASILVEVGFVTNKQEAARLKKPAYLDRLAEAIAQAIYDYMKEKAPAI